MVLPVNMISMRPSCANFARQALGASVTGNNAQLCFGQTELRVLRSDSEMTSQRQLAAATSRDAVDRSNHGHAAIFDFVRKSLASFRNFAARVVSFSSFGKFGDVGAGAEGFFTCTRQDDGADI